jgi:hypothetical protein
MYVSTDNLISLAPMQTDGGRMIGTDGRYEFFWRQPRDAGELRLALEAADQDAMGSYAWDGLVQWTPLAISLWWAGRARLVAHLRTKLESTRHAPKPWEQTGLDHDVLRRHLAYVEGGMETDLRRLLYFCEHHVVPAAGVPLPLL